MYLYIYIYENILKTLGLQKSRVQKYFFVQDEDYSGFIPSFCRRLTVRIIIIIRVSNTYACTYSIILWFSAVWWILYYIAIRWWETMSNWFLNIRQRFYTLYDPPTYMRIKKHNIHNHTHTHTHTLVESYINVHSIHTHTHSCTHPHAQRGGHTFIYYIII